MEWDNFISTLNFQGRSLYKLNRRLLHKRPASMKQKNNFGQNIQVEEFASSIRCNASMSFFFLKNVCEPGTSSSNTFIDTSTKSNTYDMTTSSSPTVIQSVKSKTLRPKFSKSIKYNYFKKRDTMIRFQ